jgi:hypothetical protein
MRYVLFVLIPSALISTVALAASDVFPMPRDAAITQFVGAYSNKSCTTRVLEGLKITADECAARTEKAKEKCPTLIAEGLLKGIDEKQLGIVVARSVGCLMMMIVGKPYENAPWDKTAEDVRKQNGS